MPARYRVEIDALTTTFADEADLLSYLRVFELSVPRSVLWKLQPGQPMKLRLDAKGRRFLRLVLVDDNTPGAVQPEPAAEYENPF